MSEPIEYLDLEDLILLAETIVGAPAPIRDVGLLESAAARHRTSLFGEDAYPDVYDKAAALLQSLLKNHPLVDGNKRLGWLATAVFLELNEVPVTHVSNDSVYDFVIDVASSNQDVADIGVQLRELLSTA